MTWCTSGYLSGSIGPDRTAASSLWLHLDRGLKITDNSSGFKHTNVVVILGITFGLFNTSLENNHSIKIRFITTYSTHFYLLLYQLEFFYQNKPRGLLIVINPRGQPMWINPRGLSMGINPRALPMGINPRGLLIMINPRGLPMGINSRGLQMGINPRGIPMGINPRGLLIVINPRGLPMGINPRG